MRFLVLVVWVVAVVVILVSCESAERVTPSSGLYVAVDSIHGVACYHFAGYSNSISCVRVSP